MWTVSSALQARRNDSQLPSTARHNHSLLLGPFTRMVRIDRFLTLHFFGPLIRTGLITGCAGIPILMYHSISDEIEPGMHPYFQISTSRDTFAAHMSLLYEEGYSVLTIPEAMALMADPDLRPRRAVVLTFDDGFRDFFTEAFPILHNYGFRCTVFLPTAFLDDPTLRFKGRQCLSWDQVRELHRYGIMFGSHTMTHPQLTALTTEAVGLELEQSKKRIEIELQEKVLSFSYPYAFPQEKVQFITSLKELLLSYGYAYGVTTAIGTSNKDDDPLFLKRIPANDYDDLNFLKAKLSGEYNWIYNFQHVSKCTRSLIPNFLNSC